MDITIGRTVHYRLSENDATQINRRRTTGKSIADRMKLELDRLNHQRDEGVQAFAWPAGAQAHIGNTAAEGDVVPLVVVRVSSPTVCNGQALLDGNDVLWVTSAHEGTEPGTWAWPPRA